MVADAGLGALLVLVKDAATSALALKKLVAGPEAQSRTSELYGLILNAQTQTMEAQLKHRALLDQISDLENEVARLKAWNTNKERYELKMPVEGTFVYALKRNPGASEPAHWICAKCYEDNRKSILQLIDAPGRRATINCMQCNSQIPINASLDWLMARLAE